MKFSIETSRLHLRPFTMMDVNDFFNMTRDETICSYIPGVYRETLEEVIELFETSYIHGNCLHDFYIAIEEKRTKKLVGSLIVTERFVLEDYDVCYFIKKDYRRNGYIFEALSAFLENFPVLNTNLIFQIENDNTSSLKVIEKFSDIKESPSDFGGYRIFSYHVEN